MNKQEAKREMSNGAKVRHKTMPEGEWVKIEGGMIQTESGEEVDEFSFWQYWVSHYFNEGWEVVEEASEESVFQKDAIQILRSLVSEYEFTKPLLLNGGHRMNDAEGFMANMDRAEVLIKKIEDQCQ